MRAIRLVEAKIPRRLLSFFAAENQHCVPTRKRCSIDARGVCNSMRNLGKVAYGITYAVIFAVALALKWSTILVVSIIYAAFTYDKRR